MNIETAITDLFEIKHPIIQAPMAGESNVRLVSEVGTAGALGSLGCAKLKSDEVRSAATELRLLGDYSFNFNFFCHPPPDLNGQLDSNLLRALQDFSGKKISGLLLDEFNIQHKPFDEEMLKVVLECKPKVVSFHFGSPSKCTIDQLKNAGCVVISSATTVKEALILEKRGVDAVIAQGWEAGGHRGTFDQASEFEGIGMFSLLPQVVDAISIPVIAAGGIADGRGIAAALVLGASAVQIGTSFLSTSEVTIDADYRTAINSAKAGDTAITKAYSGRMARARSNKYIQRTSHQMIRFPDYPGMYQLFDQVFEAVDNKELECYLYGQSAPLNREMGAAALIEKLVDETRVSLRNTSGLLCLT